MEILLENARKAVDKYKSKQSADGIKATRAVLSSVISCRKFVDENEREDRGIAQRLAREISEILSPIPMFRNFALDKKALHNLHTKKLAEEHLEKIQKDLELSLKNLELNRKRKIHEWVRSHPVLGKLRRQSSKKLPPDAYILLFYSERSGRQKGRRASSKAPVLKNAGDAGSILPTVITEGDESSKFAESQTGIIENCLISDDKVLDRNSGSILCEDTGLSPLSELQADSDADNALPAEPGQNAVSTTAAIAESPLLLVKSSADGRVFTRFRIKDFVDDLRVYRSFRTGPAIVGACVISEGKLLAAMGELPGADAGKNQIRVLLSLSREAIKKPGKEFVESNPVLKELFSLYRNRELHKDAYVLLFQSRTQEDERCEEVSDTGGCVSAAECEPLEGLESVTVAEESEPGQAAAPAEADGEISSEDLSESEIASLTEDSAENDSVSGIDAAESEYLDSSDVGMQDEAAEIDSAELESGADSFAETLALKQEQNEVSADSSLLNLELVTKKTDDGRLLTRFRSFDFTDLRTLYESFKKRGAVLGAAIIRDRELVKIIGMVPAESGEDRLQTLLRLSNQALEKPSLDFVASNEIISSIFKLAGEQSPHTDCYVILFSEKEGRPTVMAVPDRRGISRSKLPLSEFRNPKFVLDRFKNSPLPVGASVIRSVASEPLQGRESRERNAGGKGGKRPDSQFRNAPAVAKPPVVLSAFGRTPLKQNVILSPEILKRLGVDPSIIQPRRESETR